jgi:ABC-type xylose transport system permease subunit
MLVGLAIAVELANRWITVALCIAVGGVIGAVIGSIRSRRR